MNQQSSISFGVAARNAVLKVVAFWVLLVAAYLAIGRQFFPYIERLKPEVEIWLSDQLGTEVEIGQLEGEWVRFNPVIHLSDVRLGDKLSVQSMTLAPGLYESVSRGGLSFIRFEVSDFNAEVVQTDTGWQMTGLVASRSEKVTIDLDAVLALVRRQQAVIFSNVVLDIKPLGLPRFTLQMEQGRMTGYGEENGLVANALLRANNYEVPIELQVETTDNASGLNRVYFQHGEIDLSPWLTKIKPELSTANIAGEYWIQLDGTHWTQAASRLYLNSVSIQGKVNNVEVRDGQADVFMTASGDGFDGAVSVLAYQLNNQQYSSTQAKAHYADDHLTLQWDSLPAQWVTHVLAMNDSSGFWQGISPAGYVEQGLLNWNRKGAEPLTLFARVAELSLQSYDAVPGLSGLNGQLVMEGNRGEIIASAPNARFQLSNVFSDHYTARIHETKLSWLMKPGEGSFAHGTATLELEPLIPDAEQGNLPVDVFWRSGTASSQAKARGRESSLELQLSIPEANLYWVKTMASTQPVDPSVSALIDNRLESGVFKNIRLDYLNSFDAQRNTHPQFFISSDFDHVDTTFLNNWQPVQALNGELYLDRYGVSLTSESGHYPGFDLRDITFNLPYQKKEIDIHLAASSGVPETMHFLQTGPLRHLYGDRLDQWDGQGQVDLDLSLSVPLKKPDAFDVQVMAEIVASEFSMNDVDLLFTDVTGVLGYNHDRGLYADELRMHHLGQAQTVQLSSQLQTIHPKFNVTVQGKTSVKYWGERFGDVYLTQFDEWIEHQTTIHSSSQRVQITSQADLINIPLNFPAPLNKPVGESLPLQLNINLDSRKWTTVKSQLGDKLQSYIELNQHSQIQRATIAYDTPLEVRKENGIYFDIQVSETDGSDWWQSILELREIYADGIYKKQSIEPLIRSIHIRGEQIDYLAQPWTQADVTILRNDNAWLVSFTSEEGQGQVLIPHNGDPLFAELQWVSLTTGERNIPFEAQVDPLLNYQPTAMPDMQILINKLIWNDRDFGDWQAVLTSQEDKLEVTNIVGNMPGAKMTATLEWDVSDSKPSTRFNGAVAVNNIADVLNTWQYAPVLTSRSGQIKMNAQWEGSPAFFDFKRLKGDMTIRLNKGAIKEVEEYEGVKLIGLLNFTRVLQRIALDFSDLMESGITYDIIDGELLFDRGFARVGEKLLIDGSATRFHFSGDADLLSNSLDVDMVLTVPLSSTFPLVALLAGVSPQAAAAIYVTERVFNNELERISSARMHITGSFEDPQTRFYRVFESGLDNDRLE